MKISKDDFPFFSGAPGISGPHIERHTRHPNISTRGGSFAAPPLGPDLPDPVPSSRLLREQLRSSAARGIDHVARVEPHLEVRFFFNHMYLSFLGFGPVGEVGFEVVGWWLALLGIIFSFPFFFPPFSPAMKDGFDKMV
jgi:hypothetical protein